MSQLIYIVALLPKSALGLNRHLHHDSSRVPENSVHDILLSGVTYASDLFLPLVSLTISHLNYCFSCQICCAVLAYVVGKFICQE